STSTHAPEPSCSCSRPAYCATRTTWTAEAALITRCAPSTSAARSTEATFTAPAWASAKASRNNARACESLSIMCPSLDDSTDTREDSSPSEARCGTRTFRRHLIHVGQGACSRLTPGEHDRTVQSAWFVLEERWS